jgi:hypothetical protein
MRRQHGYAYSLTGSLLASYRGMFFLAGFESLLPIVIL